LFDEICGFDTDLVPMTHGDRILYLRVQRETNASGDDELCDPEHVGTIVRSDRNVMKGYGSLWILGA
jgi:hypothetical protein